MEEKTQRTTKGDLRWRRSEKRIMEAFAEGLETRPIKKISVTWLAERAEINKATFYLHYHDIYDLLSAYVDAQVKVIADQLPAYELFFSNPQRFAEKFLAVLEEADFLGLYKKLDENMLVGCLTRAVHARFHERYSASLSDRDYEEGWAETVFLFDGMLAVIIELPDVGSRKMAAMLGRLASGLRRPSPGTM